MTRRRELRAYMDWLARQPCVVCGDYGVHLHHPRFAAGMGQRASDWLLLPLCPPCHTGSQGIHGDRSRWRLYQIDEPQALARVIEMGALERFGRH